MNKTISSVLLVSALCVCHPSFGSDPLSAPAIDPFESVNRVVFSFNDRLDRFVFRPIASGYAAVVPAPVRRVAGNFFSNLGEPATAINDVLQMKLRHGAADTARFVFNSTLGVAGLFDVASMMGLEKRDEDFGQTLAYYGVGEGPYLVVPFLGPSNLRDISGTAVDSFADPIVRHDESRESNSLMAARAIDARANLLGADNVLSSISTDKYLFVREAYRQSRWNDLYDGNPPEYDFED